VKLLLSICITGHVFSSHGEIGGGECHESRDKWTSNGGLYLRDSEKFAW
jgi:hypothetical protein